MLKLADNVTVLETVTSHNLPVERVLAGAAAANLSNVIIVGYDADGEFYFASSNPDGPSCLWDLEMAKKKLLEVAS